jgi:hypothetical protein
MAQGWIKLSYLNSEEFAAALGNKKSQLQEALSVRVNALLFQLQTKLSVKIKQVMNRGYATGKLASSVNVQPATIQGDTIEGSTGIPHGPTYDYGAAHELGHAGAYRITATARKALAWQMSTKAKGMAYARFVTHPAIPALHFVSSTAEENREDVLRQLQETVNEVLNRKP